MPSSHYSLQTFGEHAPRACFVVMRCDDDGQFLKETVTTFICVLNQLESSVTCLPALQSVEYFFNEDEHAQHGDDNLSLGVRDHDGFYIRG